MSETALSAIAEINPGARIPKEITGSDEVSFIPMSDVSESGDWTTQQARPLRSVTAGFTAFEEGDVLVAKITPCLENGKGAHARGLRNGIGFGSTEFHVLRAKPGVDPRFVFHVTQSRRFRQAAERQMVGSAGQQRVQRLFFDEFLVRDFSQDEQAVIARILDTLDTAIREAEALIDKLKAVKQGLLHDLLTRGIDANGQLRPPQSEAPQLYKESPLGWIPREWTGARLADVCAPNRPITYGVLKPGDYKENGIPLLQIQDVIHGSINFGNVHRISESLDLAYSRTRIYGGEIVISLVGTIGKVAQIPYECERSNLHRNLGLIAIQKSDIPEFFLWFLRSERFSEQVLNETFGSTQSLLNLNSVRGFAVPVPPAGERQQIAELMNGSELHIKQEIIELKKLERTKIGLMDDLLTGRGRVTPLLESVQQAAAPIVHQSVGQTGA
ncbi:restriction endonuclease subunit S [Azotobacter beijerinckii]|uniref:Type I restriction enzyme, S subunit n=1 Tax=Azotobacter beijerinckii TaxID=170623 RepID=A0A1I4BAI8_9GAMM|nr:restriction endonuclease subunit S [Azotobacter beijerinckii]SFB05275.1 type I restriction enzyme, S subunit [Azotobacter beijerinckii]SFK65011.1 type I restriction enzyme, S subunit [Azotobacter beijerinckii]